MKRKFIFNAENQGVKKSVSMYVYHGKKEKKWAHENSGKVAKKRETGIPVYEGWKTELQHRPRMQTLISKLRLLS
jgi:hypothetical protein